KSIVTRLTEVADGGFPRAGRKSPGTPTYSGFYGCKSILNWDVVLRENRLVRKPWVRDRCRNGRLHCASAAPPVTACHQPPKPSPKSALEAAFIPGRIPRIRV